MNWEDFGIGLLKVSPCILAEFAAQKPDDLEILGSEYCHNPNSPGIVFVVRGPMIPVVPDSFGIPEIECLVTKLEDGSLKWDFNAK